MASLSQDELVCGQQSDHPNVSWKCDKYNPWKLPQGMGTDALRFFKEGVSKSYRTLSRQTLKDKFSHTIVQLARKWCKKEKDGKIFIDPDEAKVFKRAAHGASTAYALELGSRGYAVFKDTDTEPGPADAIDQSDIARVSRKELEALEHEVADLVRSIKEVEQEQTMESIRKWDELCGHHDSEYEEPSAPESSGAYEYASTPPPDETPSPEKPNDVSRKTKRTKTKTRAHASVTGKVQS